MFDPQIRHGGSPMSAGASLEVQARKPDVRSVRMLNRLRAFLKDDSGATAIEYGLIAAGISVAIIAVVNGLGTSLNAKFKSISTQLK